MGAVITTGDVYEAFMQGPEHMIELFHGYTYSGNPIASAAGIATLETYNRITSYNVCYTKLLRTR